MLRPGQDLRKFDLETVEHKEAITRLLEDARWAFSGMIYGFNFRWSPASRVRGIEEIFEIHPMALIPRGDPRMQVVMVSQEGDFVYVTLEYHLDEFQTDRVSGWQGLNYPTSSGAGIASIHDLHPRYHAMSLAIKESLRAWLRAREYNQPQEVSGRVGLLSFPSLSVFKFGMRASVNIAMDLKSFTPYQID